MPSNRTRSLGLAALLAAGFAGAGWGQTPPVPVPAYADLADLAITAPIAAQVRIRDAQRIKPLPGQTFPPASQRFLVTADVVALIRGAGGVPPQIRYLVDLPVDAKGKVPKLKKSEKMIFAAPVPKRNNEVQLVAPDAQLALTPGVADRVRSIIAAATRADAPPRVSGVGDAFHVAGGLSGQGETQIFLIADDGSPISFTIWREPGAATRWAVALDEVVDQAGGPPPRDSLLWYRLACFLPGKLPTTSIARLEPETARIAAEDYQTVMNGLGPCKRMRQRR